MKFILNRTRLNKQGSKWRKICILGKFIEIWRNRLEEKEDEEIKPKLVIADSLGELNTQYIVRNTFCNLH